MGMLDGKVAIVTGAGHGIGRGHALELAHHGAAVVVNDLGTSVRGEGRGRDADVVVDLITSRGGKAVANYGDVSNADDVDEMVKAALDNFGQLDIVVNNAGIVRDKVIWNMDVEDFDLVMAVHVRGTWLLTKAAAAHWRNLAKSTGQPTVYGRIINTTSGAGLSGNFGQSNYAAAKAAIVGLTLTVSLELASIGVTANVIGPGGLTRISSTMPGAEAPQEFDPTDGAEFDPRDPTLSAPVVAWLASPDAQYVSGQVIKAFGENIQLMEGWTPAVTLNNGGQRWDATKLGSRFAIDVFKTRAPGLRLG